MKPLFLLLTTLILTACSTSQKFVESDLAPSMYKGYWAMTPVNDIHRVIKFHSTGMVKIYDYECDFDSYRLNSIETVYLNKEKHNTFTILDEKKKPFARFEIKSINAQRFNAKEQFIDAKIEPHSLSLNYINTIGAKPICTPSFY